MLSKKGRCGGAREILESMKLPSTKGNIYESRPPASVLSEHVKQAKSDQDGKSRLPLSRLDCKTA
jgi:hypothetical protein